MYDIRVRPDRLGIDRGRVVRADVNIGNPVGTRRKNAPSGKWTPAVSRLRTDRPGMPGHGFGARKPDWLTDHARGGLAYEIEASAKWSP